MCSQSSLPVPCLLQQASPERGRRAGPCMQVGIKTRPGPVEGICHLPCITRSLTDPALGSILVRAENRSGQSSLAGIYTSNTRGRARLNEHSYRSTLHQRTGCCPAFAQCHQDESAALQSRLKLLDRRIKLHRFHVLPTGQYNSCNFRAFVLYKKRTLQCQLLWVFYAAIESFKNS